VAVALPQSRTQREEKVETFLWHNFAFEVHGDRVAYLGVHSQMGIAEERRSLDDTYFGRNIWEGTKSLKGPRCKWDDHINP